MKINEQTIAIRCKSINLNWFTKGQTYYTNEYDLDLFKFVVYDDSNICHVLDGEFLDNFEIELTKEQKLYLIGDNYGVHRQSYSGNLMILTDGTIYKLVKWSNNKWTTISISSSLEIISRIFEQNLDYYDRYYEAPKDTKNELYIPNAHIYFRTTKDSAEEAYRHLKEILDSHGIEITFDGQAILRDENDEDMDSCCEGE